MPNYDDNDRGMVLKTLILWKSLSKKHIKMGRFSPGNTIVHYLIVNLDKL